MLGLVPVLRRSLVAASGGYSLVALGGLVTAVASLVVEHELWGANMGSRHWLSICGAEA